MLQVVATGKERRKELAAGLGGGRGVGVMGWWWVPLHATTSSAQSATQMATDGPETADDLEAHVRDARAAVRSLLAHAATRHEERTRRIEAYQGTSSESSGALARALEEGRALLDEVAPEDPATHEEVISAKRQLQRRGEAAAAARADATTAEAQVQQLAQSFERSREAAQAIEPRDLRDFFYMPAARIVPGFAQIRQAAASALLGK